MDEMILEFFRKNPNTGLYDVSAWIYTQDPSRWQRNADPVHTCRTRVNTRIKSLCSRGYLNYKKPDGRKSLYTVREW